MRNLWWKNAVFYELYVDKFVGDFRKLTEHLDYFVKLGVDCLHILPHYPSPMIDDGYDVSDYRGVRPELGTLEDFRKFVRSAHTKNIRVMADFVLNHVSQEHPWFIEARSSKNNPRRDYFIWSESGVGLRDSINAFPHLKPSNWIYNPSTKDYYYATFYPEQPDLNWGNKTLFEEMMAALDFWIDIGVDGFRFDASSHLIKKEGTRSKGLPETHLLLRCIRSHIEKVNPGVALLAEVHDTIPEVKKYFGEGKGNECHLVYNFPLAERLFLAVIRSDRLMVPEMVSASFDIPADCQWAVFLRNHDELSLGTLTGDERNKIFEYCDPERRYAFRGEEGLSMRMASIFKREPEKVRDAFKMLISLQVVPIIYYGEEIGMQNDETIGLPKDTRRYVRGKFDWTSAYRQMEDPNSLFSFVAGLIHERK